MRYLSFFVIAGLLAACGGARPERPNFGTSGGATGTGNGLPGGTNAPGSGNLPGGTPGQVTTNPQAAPGQDQLDPALFLKTPVVTPIRRLLNREYIQSLNDIVGETPNAKLSMLLPDAAGSNFDNNITVQNITTDRLQGYIKVAGAAAKDLLASNRAAQVIGCAPASANKACIDTLLATVGKRAYRRSLDATEIAAYQALFASTTPAEGVENVLTAILASPNFIFMPELGVNPTKAEATKKLTGVELAARLSILILGTVPSAELIDSAAKGSLDTAAGIDTAARAMLSKKEAKTNFRSFVRNWLKLSELDTITTRGTVLPDNLKGKVDQLSEETYLLFEDFMAPNKKFMDVFTAPYTYLTPELGSLYKMNVSGNWKKTELANTPRLGFLSQPSVLAVTGAHTYPSIARGIFMRESLLCQSLPPLPENTTADPAIVAANAKASERDRLTAVLNKPACVACHSRMNVAGHGMERYDRLGVYDVKDLNGNMLSGAGEMTQNPVFSFTDIPELANKLHESFDVQTCVAKKLTEQLMGRIPNTKGDEVTIGIVRKAILEKDFIEAIVAFVKSDAFTTRRMQ